MWGGGAEANEAFGPFHGVGYFIISVVHKNFPLVFQNDFYGEQKLQAYGNKLNKILKNAFGGRENVQILIK